MEGYELMFISSTQTQEMMEELGGEREHICLIGALESAHMERHFYLSHSFPTVNGRHLHWSVTSGCRQKERGGVGQHTVMTQELPLPHNNPTNKA